MNRKTKTNYISSRLIFICLLAFLLFAPNSDATFSRFDHGYDLFCQLRVADSSVNSLDRGYAYDPAWNLAWRTNAGTAESFAVDSRNQLTSVPGGTVAYDSNGNMVSTDNAGRRYAYDAENQLVTITVTNTSPYYRTTLVYDGLLRLRQRFEYTGSPPYNHTNPPPDDPASALLFALEESQSDPGTITWTLNSETRYLYDGMRVIQERDGSNTPTVSYTRGTDLGGSLEGAGGIGGLLGRSHGYSAGNWAAHNYYHADGNGNITALVGTNQSVSARYAYDPFGNITGSSGALAAANVYRFSSKEQHAVSGFYYYGYRWYAPGLQRWLNRDPFGSPSSQLTAKMFGSPVAQHYEEGIFVPELLPEGPNLYTFVGNDPVNLIDSDGKAVPIIAIGVVVARAGFLAYRYHRSMAAAAAAARAGQSMIARNRATAQAIACRAGQGAPPVRHPPHGPRPEFLPHYHPNPTVTPPHTHIWWGRQPLESYPRIPSGNPSVP